MVFINWIMHFLKCRLQLKQTHTFALLNCWVALETIIASILTIAVWVFDLLSKLSQLLKRHDEELWRHMEVTTKVGNFSTRFLGLTVKNYEFLDFVEMRIICCNFFVIYLLSYREIAFVIASTQLCYPILMFSSIAEIILLIINDVRSYPLNRNSRNRMR
jgi:hypothetical protein